MHDKAVINCQYSVATFSGIERKNRPHGDWKSIEMTMHLKQTFEAVILTEKFPKSQIDIYVEVGFIYLSLAIKIEFNLIKFTLKVLQSDGSNYCACVNAATLAIIDAGIPIKDYVCACSVSLIRDTPLIDINHLEETSGSPHINIALLPNYDQIVLLESESRMHVDYMDKMLDSAMVGCKDIYAVLNKYIKSRVASLSKNFSSLI